MTNEQIKVGDKVVYTPLNRWDSTIHGRVIFAYDDSRVLVKTKDGNLLFHVDNLKKDD